MADSKGDSSEAVSSGLWNSIPSLYYDLIARICPGMAFLIALSVQESDTTQHFSLTKLPTFSVASVVVLVALSYLVGMVLTGVSFVWDLLFLGLVSTSKGLRRHLQSNKRL
jgi:hypothetical protein